MVSKRLNYLEYGNLVEKLLTLIKTDKSARFRYVFGIARGGLPISIHLAHHLDLTFISEIQVDVHTNILAVDDLSDSGNTLSKLLEKDPSIKTATLYYKPWSLIKPTYFVEEIEDWVVFPWEKDL